MELEKVEKDKLELEVVGDYGTLIFKNLEKPKELLVNIHNY